MVNVDVNGEVLKSMVNSFIDDDTTMLEIHNSFARRCDPYVPMAEGNLAQSAFAHVTPEYVQYGDESVPYAHYQYTGEVYGPNIPIIENGIIVGWFSPKNQPKYPTGRPINYSTEMHPKATSHWDQAMMRDEGEEFCKDVENILTRRAQELYGS